MLHTQSFGSKSSPPLLFLHGLLGSAEDFLPMIQKLKKKFYCISIDLPGHGPSPLIRPLTLENTLDAILEVLQHHKIQKTSIIGYSLGGRLAMLMDYHYPEFFDRLIILSAHPGLEPKEKEKKLEIEKKWISLLEQDENAFLKSWYSQPLFKTLDVASMIKKRSPLNKESIIQVMEQLSLTKQISLWNHLKKTKKPFLFLYGQHDETYKELYKNLPSTLIQKQIPLASHAIHLENPLACIVTLL